MTSAAASGNGRYCCPLTVADGFSRYLLGCCGIGLLGRSASESGRLRDGDRGQGPGDRRRRALMSTILRFSSGYVALLTGPIGMQMKGIERDFEPLRRCRPT